MKYVFNIEMRVCMQLYYMVSDAVSTDGVLQVFATYSGCLLLGGSSVCFLYT